MKIIKIGTFSKDGWPINWSIDGNEYTGEGYCLGIDMLGPGIVDVNGIEIVEWTEERARLKED